MKLLLLVLIFLHAAVCYCQEDDMRISLSAKGTRITVSLNDNNIDRTFNLKKTNISANDYFTATVFNEQIDTSWIRNFTIHNTADSVIASLKETKNNTYSISLKELVPQLQTGSQYYLYTIALPVDPKKRMLVKVVRRIVCAITLRN
jgi:hypothetical protein